MKSKLLTCALVLTLLTVSGCKVNDVYLIETENPSPSNTSEQTNVLTPLATEAPATSSTPETVILPSVTLTPETVILPSETSAPKITAGGKKTPELTKAPETQTKTEKVYLSSSWEFADFSEINSGYAVLYRAESNRKNLIIGVNAGHGTKGGTSKKTYCHPDKTPKLTGGTTAKGSLKAVAVSSGMSFNDGTSEAKVNLRTAQILKDMLLADGYDVLMIRDGDDVQLDNVARMVICNNIADCHIAIHFDGDGLDYDKGCFYLRAPDGLKSMYPVSQTWQKSHKLGDSIIEGLRANGSKIRSSGSTVIDLTQTSYSKVPSVNIELGNQSSKHNDEALKKLAAGVKKGIDNYFIS